MFDLESAIRKWKKGLAANPGLEDGTRAELEASLRDEIADRVRRGRCPEEAFRRVVEDMGGADALGREFFKVHAAHRFGAPSWARSGFSPGLLLSYAKIAVRKIRRQKGYALINIAGLAVGLACCALMVLWVRHERSFDRFHANGASIYRVIKKTSTGGSTMLDARTPFPLGPAVLGRVPEVVDFCRFQGYEGRNVKRGDTVVTLADNFGTADPSFFRMFTFPLVEGDPRTALDGPDSLVLTQSAARQIFGTAPAMGQAVTRVGGFGTYRVTGILKDFPKTSHIRVDSLVGIHHDAPAHDVAENDWATLFYYTYIQLAPGASADTAARKIAAVLNGNVKDLKAEIVLQPLRDVHLRSSFQWDLDNTAQGSQATLTLFTLAALGVLLLAIVNFMNLSTARSANRAKEVGLRKVSGARRSEILGQFLGESVLLAFLGLAAAAGIVSAALPLFNSLAGKNLAFSGLLEPLPGLGLVGMTLLTGLLSGLYPAVFLSAFQPSHVLKGGVVSGGRAQAALRKGLVVVQFALTLFFVMGTAVVARQLKYVRAKDLGIDVRGVVAGIAYVGDFNPVRSALLANPAILSAGMAEPPNKEQRGLSGVFWDGKDPSDESQFFPLTVGEDYLRIFQLKLAEGRFFSREFPTDAAESVVLNQTAARLLGPGSAVGRRMTIGRRAYSVIGVVRDFHQTSLHRPIEPMILRNGDSSTCARIDPKADRRETLAFIESTLKKFSVVPDSSVFLEFIDDRVDGFYAAERKVEAVLRLFTAVALFTACLGLLGLASFLAEKRTREIGLRKVMGARTTGLVGLQAREFAKWILVAGLIAGPAAYYAAGRWLSGFAYRTNMPAELFVLAILGTLAVALLTVGYQSLRAAWARPAEALRHE